MFTRIVFLTGLVLWFTGCALSPQQVTLKPAIAVPTANWGNQQDINVSVRDHRSSVIVGTRGGVYGDTSIIEVGNDWASETAYALASALVHWSFKPLVNGRQHDAMDFSVALEELSYIPDRAVAGKVAINAVVTVEVQRGGSTFHGKYTASGNMGYVTAPSERQNSEHLNQILSLALQKIFEDPALVKFLQE